MIEITAQVVGSGPRGEIGPQGPQGLQGEQGLKGDKGDKGEQGIQGIQGVKGDKGDKGDTGEQGVQGIQGVQGEQGPKGDTGNDGYTPIKGTDYFTDAEITEILAPVNSQLAETLIRVETVEKASTKLYKKYGVRIDKTNSNPSTRVVYIDDAIGFTPMSGGDGSFSWGSWQEVFDNLQIRPCLLKNGIVNYYINPDDFTKKMDGTASDITSGVDGDVMIEFAKPIWYKWTDEGTTYTIEISDAEFDGAVKNAFEIEPGYNLFNYYPLLLTQILFAIFFKSTDSQKALGRGRVDNAGYVNSGGANAKGMFWGSTADLQVKFLGIEDYWGNKLQWIDGIVTDSSWNLLIGKSGLNDTGSGYTSFSSGLAANTAGYINSVQGGNEKGFIIKTGAGSDSTYLCDYGNLDSSQVASFGGASSAGSAAGFTTRRLANAVSVSNAGIGSRLFCASTNKMYIGAYLGYNSSSKLRSLSNTLATASLTIGSFRTLAKANN